MNNLQEYEDILLPRKQEWINLSWCFREINPEIAYIQTPEPTPQKIKDLVRNSPGIKHFLLQLTKRQNISLQQLEKQIQDILDEIGYQKDLKLLRWLGYILVKIFFRVSSGILVNNRSVQLIKSHMGHCPVVFIPSHRSYADFILMSYIFFNYNIAIPAIAAGMDFQKMFGMGTMLRYTGAFYMRRSYNDDYLYWALFKEYIHQLITKGNLPIEFFIEGTRSRTGKSLTPKFGLMNMILKAFFLSEVPDIMLVPLNISYDRVLEEKLFAFELLGVPKPKESTSGFFKSLQIVQEKYGKIYVNFANPISVREYFGSNVDRSYHSKNSLYDNEITEKEKSLLPPLAYEIIKQQQKHSVLTTFNLIAILLNNSIIKSENQIHFSKVIDNVKRLKIILENYGATVDLNNEEKDILDSIDVHKILVKINENNSLTLVTKNIILDKHRESELKGHALIGETITNAVPLVMLQLYVNPVMHYVVDSCILVTVLKYSINSSRDELLKKYTFLRSLFSNEFVIFPSKISEEFFLTLSKLEDLRIIEYVNDSYHLTSNQWLQEILFNLLQPFIFTYVVSLKGLTQNIKMMTEKTVIQFTQKWIEYFMNLKRYFIHPYSLNINSISNCLSNLISNGIIKKVNSNSTLLILCKETFESSMAQLELFLPPCYVDLITEIHQHCVPKHKL